MLLCKGAWQDVERRGSSVGSNRHVAVGAYKGGSCCYQR